MTQRIRNRSVLYNHRPFTGQGVSLYVAADAARVNYRRTRIVGGGRSRRRRRWIKGTGGDFDIASSMTKTARVGTVTHPTAQIVYALPAELLPVLPETEQDVTFDLRHFKDDVESEVSNYRTVRVTVDNSGNEVLEIRGSARLLSQEPRVGGVVRLRFRYLPARDGVQPTQFVATRTAGPTSPADATVTYGGERIIEIDTPALSDASPYTYTIRVENGATTQDLLTGIGVQADATGPPAPINGSTETK